MSKLKARIEYVIQTYHNGNVTSYASNMRHAVEQYEAGNKEYSISGDDLQIFCTQKIPFSTLANHVEWSIMYLIGEGIINEGKL